VGSTEGRRGDSVLFQSGDQDTDGRDSEEIGGYDSAIAKPVKSLGSGKRTG